MAGRTLTRNRIVIASTGAVATIALVAAVVWVKHSSSESSNRPSKEVAITELPRFDAAVVLPADTRAANAWVRDALERTDAVKRYAILPADALAIALSFDPQTTDAKALRARVCKPSATRSFAVELARSVPDGRQRLAAAIGTHATVQPIAHRTIELEVFMTVHASAAQAELVRAHIERDPDVVKYKFLDHAAAYDEFKKLFADQPVLIQSETPAGLPESFRVEIRDGASPNAVGNRFQHLSGVDQVNTPRDPLSESADSPLGFKILCRGLLP